MVKRTADHVDGGIEVQKRIKMASAMQVDSPPQAAAIDEDLHSRQLAVYGRESMGRMASASILIIGVKGLGVEIGTPLLARLLLCPRGPRPRACGDSRVRRSVGGGHCTSAPACAAKNVILAGVKKVALYDPTPVVQRDLGAQFYLAEADVGRPTAEACRARLQELNTSVKVVVQDSVSEGVLKQFQARVRLPASPPTPGGKLSSAGELAPGRGCPRGFAFWILGSLLSFSSACAIVCAAPGTTPTARRTLPQAVVCTSLSLEEVKKYDAFCRAQTPTMSFIYARICGVFAQVFCDFGPVHIVSDPDGVRPQHAASRRRRPLATRMAVARVSGKPQPLAIIANRRIARLCATPVQWCALSRRRAAGDRNHCVAQ